MLPKLDVTLSVQHLSTFLCSFYNLAYIWRETALHTALIVRCVFRSPRKGPQGETCCAGVLEPVNRPVKAECVSPSKSMCSDTMLLAWNQPWWKSANATYCGFLKILFFLDGSINCLPAHYWSFGNLIICFSLKMPIMVFCIQQVIKNSRLTKASTKCHHNLFSDQISKLFHKGTEHLTVFWKWSVSTYPLQFHTVYQEYFYGFKKFNISEGSNYLSEKYTQISQF